MRRTKSKPGPPSSRWFAAAIFKMFALKDADSVDGYVVFNIRHNRYRLITIIHYAKTTSERQTQGHVYIRSFLTHEEYDNRSNWDRRYGK